MMIETRDLALAYGERTIIEAMAFAAQPGTITAIIGPNGCGKSTLLSGLARLRKPQGGAILLDGRDIARLKPRDLARKLALLPQDTSAPDGLTVRDLVRFGRHPHQGLLRQWSGDDHAAVEQAIGVAGIAALADYQLDTLSGGQRQRAWIAMAIAQGTPLLLLDEPTAALDLGHQIDVFNVLKGLAASGKTIVMVVHDLAIACRYADVIVAMRGGAIVAHGPPKAVITPELVATLYGVACRIILDPLTQTPILVGVERATT